MADTLIFKLNKTNNLNVIEKHFINADRIRTGDWWLKNQFVSKSFTWMVSEGIETDIGDVVPLVQR